MHSCEGAADSIAEQDRNAVGSLNCEQNIRRIANQGIAVLIVAEHAGLLVGILLRANGANVCAMYLPASGQRPFAGEEFEKTAAVLVDIFRVVFIEASEVQRTDRHRADAAKSG